MSSIKPPEVEVSLQFATLPLDENSKRFEITLTGNAIKQAQEQLIKLCGKEVAPSAAHWKTEHFQMWLVGSLKFESEEHRQSYYDETQKLLP